MKRFVPAAALAAALCLAVLVGFAPSEKHNAETREITIQVSSETGKVGFEARFESEGGFSISTADGVTPATFTVNAEHFTGVSTAQQGATISVKASRAELTASRTNTGAARVVRNGSDFTVSGVKTEAKE